MIKVILIAVCIVLVPGVVLGLISSYRAGQLRMDLYPVFLKIKNFTQQFFSKATYKHLINYYMYYGLAIGFVAILVVEL